ncbi:MAG: cupin domain-containing protein [Christensenella sp.]|nr:cupin domain-containing protein [Christensenella sp.]
MEKLIRNIPHEKPVPLAGEVAFQPGQIVSKTLAQDNHHSLTLFAFDRGEEISTHESGGDAMILALEGQGRITIDGKEYTVTAGETIIMPAKKPHAVFAESPFKMLLIVIFPEEKKNESID